jgi:HAD superfamily hydrolase (TIGR01484 family)
MKIVIFSGGTGSTQIQNSLVEHFGKDVEYTVIVNTMDNGLSTGLVRKVFDGKINGPSDLRKNQLLRHKLMYGQTEFYKFLEKRITDSPSEIRSTIIKNLTSLKSFYTDKKHLLDVIENGVEYFFSQPKANQIDYIDFSIANIIYAGLAGKLGDLSIAGEIMEELLDLPEDAVIEISKSVSYLTASTESGHIIYDEGDLVEWNNPDDKIVDIHLVDEYGHVIFPRISTKAQFIIENADMIIFAPGTQWSSLIPTYSYIGFQEALFNSSAKAKYLVMNADEDKDIKGVSGNDLIKILDKYLPLNLITIVQSDQHGLYFDNGYVDETYVIEVANIITGNIINGNDSKHNNYLIKLIFSDYYKELISSNLLLFDFDDTIVSRKEFKNDKSCENWSLFIKLIESKRDCCIITGNTIKSIRSKISQLPNLKQRYPLYDFYIYSERGAVENNLSTLKRNNVLMEYQFSEKEINECHRIISDAGFDMTEIDNRNNFIIAIKPIADNMKKIVKNYLQLLFPDYDVCFSGKTTVEVSKKGLEKSKVIEHLIEKYDTNSISFIGDECYEGGNDYSLTQAEGVYTENVNSIDMTNIILKVLLWQI